MKCITMECHGNAVSSGWRQSWKKFVQKIRSGFQDNQQNRKNEDKKKKRKNLSAPTRHASSSNTWTRLWWKSSECDEKVLLVRQKPTPLGELDANALQWITMVTTTSRTLCSTCILPLRVGKGID